MIKKIKVHDLCVGMYIYDLNCSWLNHPFPSQNQEERMVKTRSSAANGLTGGTSMPKRIYRERP